MRNRNPINDGQHQRKFKKAVKITACVPFLKKHIPLCTKAPPNPPRLPVHFTQSKEQEKNHTLTVICGFCETILGTTKIVYAQPDDDITELSEEE